MEIQTIIQSIRKSLDRLENDEYGTDYDRVAIALTLAKELVGLIQSLFGADKIRKWKESEESTFDRFSAYLYKFFLSQDEYLSRMAPELMVESNILKEKLNTIMSRIEDVRNRTDSILKTGQPLFSQAEILEASQVELAKLTERKEHLEAISSKLSAIDMDAIRDDILKKEQVVQELELEYHPLIERKTRLEADTSRIRESIGEITGLIDGMEKARLAEITGYVEKMSFWFVGIQNIHCGIQEKIQKLESELKHEAEKLTDATNQFQEKLKQINEFSDRAYACQEALKEHFTANRQIESDLGFSLADRQGQIERLHVDIHKSLNQSDEAFTALLKQLDAAHEHIRQLSF